MPPTPVPTFSPGFRLSPFDVAILVGGTLTAVALGRLDPWTGFAAAFVVGHFFLFCNVLRMSRKPELLWAVTFATLAVAVVVLRAVSWPIALCSSAALTLVLAMLESRRPSYHGVGWRRLNPQLPTWWATRSANIPANEATTDGPR